MNVELTDSEKIKRLIEAIKPLAVIAEHTHKGEYTYEHNAEDYISVYHHDIKVKHFRAAKQAMDEALS